MTTPPKSTVRQRKKNAAQSTQRFLPIAEIHHDTVVLKNGGVRAVIQVEAINFNLKSETEQQGIIAGYQSFVNTLDFELQIVIRSSKMDIDPYLKHLRMLAGKQTNALLKEQTYAYADFIEQLVDIADIMQKRFFVVVPVDMNQRHKSLVEQFMGWLSVDDTAMKVSQRRRDFSTGYRLLTDRVNLVVSGLQNIGLMTKRLSTRELISLYYEWYNPRTSQEQKLPPEEQLKTDKATL